MDHFSIDDVRGFFLEDMSSALRRIDEAARSIAASERVARKPQLADRRGRGYFDLVASAANDLARAQGIRGTPQQAISVALRELAGFGGVQATSVLTGIDGVRGMAEECSLSVVALQQLLDASLQQDAARVAELAAAFSQRLSKWNPTIEEGKTVGRRMSTDETTPTAPAKKRIDGPSSGQVPFRGILNRIDEAAKHVLENSRAFEHDPVTPAVEATLFETIQDCAHSMCGSCSLIGLEPLSDAARLLEHFACGARIATERAMGQAQAMREAARLVQSATTAAVKAHVRPRRRSKARCRATPRRRHRPNSTSATPPSTSRRLPTPIRASRSSSASTA
jgi:hypothetical protein